MKLVFATNNRHKLEEISAIIGDKIEILGLNDIGCHDDIPETADTFEGNALLKARYVKDKYEYDCFADDTGLQVEALNGEPGVYSARYAGEPSDSEKNIDKLLANLRDAENRKASFVTCIALVTGSEEHIFTEKYPGRLSVNAEVRRDSVTIRFLCRKDMKKHLPRWEKRKKTR